MVSLRRRSLLGGAAAAAMGLPFVGNFARAGGASAPRRLLIVWSPNDPQWPEEWESPLVHGAALPASLPTFLDPLEHHRDRLSVLFDMQGRGGHVSIASVLTGVPYVGPDDNNMWGGGISVDQHIASSLGDAALTLGVACGSKNGKGRLSYTASETPVDPLEDPSIVFDGLFADLDLGQAELEQKRARQKSVLDRVAGDLSAFTQQIPAEQRPRLEQHLQSVRDIESRIDEDLLASCDPQAPGGIDASANAQVPQTLRAQMSLMAQAFGCGATRVGTLQFTRAGGGTVTPLWPDDGISIGRDPHALAHDHYGNLGNAAILAEWLAMERWYAEQFAFLLDELAAIPDVDGGTVLDNTLVVQVRECAYRHGGSPMTFVLAGGSEILTPNQALSLPDRDNEDLLATFCDKMGVDFAGFGTGSPIAI